MRNVNEFQGPNYVGFVGVKKKPAKKKAKKKLFIKMKLKKNKEIFFSIVKSTIQILHKDEPELTVIV